MTATEVIFEEIYAETEAELQPARDAEMEMISPLLRGEYERYKITPFIQRRRYRRTNNGRNLWQKTKMGAKTNQKIRLT